jgi:hypothetical protein
MVPVGGALVGTFDAKFSAEISKFYPGRASMSPVLDLFMTLAQMGQAGFLKLLQQREQLIGYFATQLAALAAKFGERVLHTPNNPISLGITIKSFTMEEEEKDKDKEEAQEDNAAAVAGAAATAAAASSEQKGEATSLPATESKQQALQPKAAAATTTTTTTTTATSQSKNQKQKKRKNHAYIGAMLFQRCVSGPRVVAPGVTKTICGHTFHGYGEHIAAYTTPYLTVSCPIGMRRADVDTFLERLEACFVEFRKQHEKFKKQQQQQQPPQQQQQDEKDAKPLPPLPEQKMNKQQQKKKKNNKKKKTTTTTTTTTAQTASSVKEQKEATIIIAATAKKTDILDRGQCFLGYFGSESTGQARRIFAFYMRADETLDGRLGSVYYCDVEHVQELSATASGDAIPTYGAAYLQALRRKPCCSSIPLSRMSDVIISELFQSSPLAADADRSCLFAVRWVGRAATRPKLTWNVQADSEQARDEWLNALRKRLEHVGNSVEAAIATEEDLP